FGQELVQLHLRPIVLAQDIVTDSAVRRLLDEAGDDIDAPRLLCHADVTTKDESKEEKSRNNAEAVKEPLNDVEERDKIRNWQPPVTGEDIMAVFEIGPGRVVGSIKSAVREAILEGEIPNSRKEALAFILNYGRALGLSVKTDVAL